jgi:Co/Zn/Cd efflux system component
MAGCCDSTPGPPQAPKIGRQRRVLGVVLAINLIMFAVEVGAGWHADSLALQADALDFLGDSVNYAIALFVLGRSLAWRAGTAWAKGAVMFGFGILLAGASVYHALTGSAPEASVMGVVGGLALAANLACALMLFGFRGEDANLRAVWLCSRNDGLCSRNDAVGNLAVLAAASGVFLSGTAWPDLLVGLVMAGLAVWAGLSVMRQARAELATAPARRRMSRLDPSRGSGPAPSRGSGPAPSR